MMMKKLSSAQMCAYLSCEVASLRVDRKKKVELSSAGCVKWMGKVCCGEKSRKESLLEKRMSILKKQIMGLSDLKPLGDKGGVAQLFSAKNSDGGHVVLKTSLDYDDFLEEAKAGSTETQWKLEWDRNGQQIKAACENLAKGAKEQMETEMKMLQQVNKVGHPCIVSVMES